MPHIEQTSMGWYVVIKNPKPYSECSKSLYLHRDGIWRTSTKKKIDNIFSGYFSTKESAQECLKNHPYNGENHER